MMLKLGPLVEKAICKDFPDCWIAIADMADLQYELYANNNSEVQTIVIFINADEFVIQKDGSITTTMSIDKKLVTQILINTLKN